jgi:rhamnosyl/mannosyltransferase
MMKILHIGKYYPPHMGGIEIYFQQLIMHQSKVMDVAAIVASDLRRTQVEFLDGAKITRVASLGVIASMPITPTMAWHIRQNKADLVHLHTPNPGAALALLTSGHSGKLIITHHADTLGRKQLRRLTDPFVRRVMERAAAIIVTSKRYLDSSEELASFRDKCRIIPLGIDPKPFKYQDAEAVARIKNEYGDRLVLAVGRLVPFKGFEYLIRAMKQVSGTLLLIGTGPLQTSLKSYIIGGGLDSKVRMINKVDNILIPPFYRAASIFVMPSITRAESFGIVQMEAMASGIPVINTDIPSGVPEVSVHGQTGFTVPPKDPEALANAINILLDNEELRQRFGAAANRRVQDEFSAEKMIARTMAVYDSVMNESR